MSELIPQKTSAADISAKKPIDRMQSVPAICKTLALCIAVVSDFVIEIIPSPYGQIVDVATGIVLFFLLGRRWELLPALAIEMIPGLGCFPTWIAVTGYILMKGKK